MKNDLTKIVFTYSSLAFGISWSIAFTIYFLFKNDFINDYQLNLFHSFAAIGPAIAAFISAYLFYGKQGFAKLLSKIKFKLPDRKTIFFVVSPLLFFIIGLFVYKIIKSDWYSFQKFTALNWSSLSYIVVWMLALLTYSIFEEIGWRGFLLPHLQEKFSAFVSTIYLTIIWALWHFPFFFYRFNFSIGIGVGFFFGIFVGSIILTSIYNSSRGFLITSMLFHFLNNLFSGFDKEIIVAVLSTCFVFIAILIYKTLGKENLSQVDRTKNYFYDTLKVL